jgi:hypothetical protein
MSHSPSGVEIQDIGMSEGWNLLRRAQIKRNMYLRNVAVAGTRARARYSDL